MKKLPFLCVLILSCATLTAAQTGARPALDNFDTGVRIYAAPTPAPAPANKTRRRQLTAFEQANVKLKPTLYAPTTGSSASMFVSKSLDGFTTGDVKVDAYIVDSATRHGVDPVLIYSIMHRESAFKKMAMSYKGARGLMQLMPGTATRFGVRNIFDPAQNIEGGSRYMRFLLDRFGGNVALALAGYNAGEGAVDKYRGVPPYRETQEYVKRISERYQLMRDPEAARRAPLVMKVPDSVASAATESPVSSLYEQSVSRVRLPNGKSMLLTR